MQRGSKTTFSDVSEDPFYTYKTTILVSNKRAFVVSKVSSAICVSHVFVTSNLCFLDVYKGSAD